MSRVILMSMFMLSDGVVCVSLVLADVVITNDTLLLS